MPRPLRSAIILAMLAAASLACFGQGKGSQSIAVSDARQLVKAIGPDRTITLKKGDYRLSSAYGVSNKYATWSDGADGKELSLSKLRNLTIRSAEGARILSDSGQTTIIAFYDSSNLSLDNLSFERVPKKGAEVGADSVYAETVQGLSFDRCSFKGPTDVAIELWECSGVAIRRTEISGAVSGAISASYSKGLEMSASRVSGCSGYPLLYIEDSEGVLFKGVKFEGNTGGDFIETFTEPGGSAFPRFSDCSFIGNKVEYFAGGSALPQTEACEYTGNSFDQNWKMDSVAPAQDESYYYGHGGKADGDALRWYEQPAGLSFAYPRGWELKEDSSRSRVGFFAPDGKSLVLFLSAGPLTPRADPSKDAKNIFAGAYAALAKLLKEETGIALSLNPEGEPSIDEGLASADYGGVATEGEGQVTNARLRMFITKASVQALVGLAVDPASLETGGEVDGIFDSVKSAGDKEP